MTVSLRRLSGREFALIAPAAVDLYLTAMEYSRAIRDQRIRVWRGEIVNPGFTAIGAFDSLSSGGAGKLAGIAYGFIGTPDRWWDQQLRRGLRERNAPAGPAQEVLSSYFEVAEIHVSPALQGRGTGREMITELLAQASTSNVLLSTPEVPNEANAAFGLYRSLGFSDVLRNFYYSGDSRPFAVLGRSLPLDGDNRIPLA